MENFKYVTSIEVKKKLLREYERLERKEFTKRAFKVNAVRLKGRQSNGRQGSGLRMNNVNFKGECFKCGQVGHFVL